MSDGSVQGGSNNDKLMVSTKFLFDLLRFSLITCQICSCWDICQTISSLSTITITILMYVLVKRIVQLGVVQGLLKITQEDSMGVFLEF